MLNWLFGRKAKKPKWAITLHGSLQQNVKLAAAWTVYAGVKWMIRDGSYTDDHPEARGKDSPFDEECFARDALAEFWGAQPAEVKATDPYLKLLASVRAAGLLREYVWRFLREPSWSAPPEVDPDKIDAWLATEGVSGHQPVTLSFLTPA